MSFRVLSGMANRTLLSVRLKVKVEVTAEIFISKKKKQLAIFTVTVTNDHRVASPQPVSG